MKKQLYLYGGHFTLIFVKKQPFCCFVLTTIFYSKRSSVRLRLGKFRVTFERMITMVSVLFVCMGNICRSPMAEAVFRHEVEKAGLTNEITIDSAGTYGGHVGSPPHHGTRQRLQKAAISYEGITARKVTAADMKRFTYIIGMDADNIADLKALAGGSQDNIYAFVDFIPNTTYKEVPDPYYTGDFEETFSLVTAGCRHLLQDIRKRYQL